MSKPNDSGRDAILDMMRFVAALLVFLFHLYLSFDLENNTSSILIEIAKVGNVGVPIFFMLSGFVITKTSSTIPKLAVFLKQRFIRLFPMLFFALVIISLLNTTSEDINFRSFLASSTLTYTMFGVDPLTGVLWTLIVEVKFYIVMGLILFFIPSIYKGGKRSVIIFAVLHVINWIILVLTNADLNTFLNGNLRFFIIGFIVYFLKKEMNHSKVYVLCWSGYLAYYIYYSVDLSSFSLKACFLLGATGLLLISKPRLGKTYGHRLCTIFGQASYPMYLLHDSLGFSIFEKCSFLGMTELECLVSSITLTSLACIVCHLLLERPAQRSLKVFLLN